MTAQLEYSFKSEASSANTFDVLRFSGEEGISSLFRFELELRSLDANLDLDKHVEKAAEFTIERGDHERKITGVLSEFDALYQKGEFTIYRAVLVPALWRLTLFHTNEVYLDNTVSDMIKLILDEAGFTSLDYKFDLYDTEREWEYRCQFSESHFDFISRITEREGIYYYFEPDGKVVFTDNMNTYPKIKEPQMYFSQHSGAAPEQTSSVITSLVGTRSKVPAKVILRDFNDDTPSVDVRGEAKVNETGLGEVNVFGQNILDVDEGNRLAKIRAEEINARAHYCHGEGDAFRTIPGYTCALQDHFRDEFNQSYCVVSIRHSGYDPRYSQANPGELPLPYNQEFTWLAASLQYRPELKTPLSEIKGTLRAIVDSEGDGHYAEIDSQGRYKVVLPFDRRTRGEGKASHWIRMMQPFGGENQGMHFPMRKGARVLLSFIGGDPDRPVINGAIPDASQPSVVNGDNQTNSMIKTAAGNKIEIEDKDGTNRIKLETPHEGTYMHLGAPNHDGSGLVVVTGGIQRVDVAGGQRLTTSVSTDDPESGSSHTNTATNTAPSGHTIRDLGFTFYVKDGQGAGTTAMTTAQEIGGGFLIERREGDKHLWTGGNEYIYGGGNVFNYGNGYEETHALYNDENGKSGIDDATEGIAGDDTESFAIPYETWNATDGCYEADGAMAGAERWDFENHTVEKVWSDVYAYQCGNNYTWGDTYDYEFGNGYAEAHNNVDDDGVPAHGHGLNYNGWPHDFFPDYQGSAATGNSVTIDADTAVIEKTFGDGYEYTNGNALAVTVGNSEEHTYGSTYEYRYGGRSEEYAFQGNGTKVSEEWSESGTGESRHYNRNGVLDSFERTDDFGALSFSTTLPTKIPTLSMEMDFSQLDTSISNSFSSTTSIETTLNVFSTELKFGATGIGTSIDLSVTGCESEITTEKCEVELPGLKQLTEWRAAELEQKAQVKLHNEVMGIVTTQLKVAQTNLDLTGSQLRLSNSLLTLLS